MSSHQRISLLGIDIGTTTCRAMVFSVERAGTDLLDPRPLYISAVEITPFQGDSINLGSLRAILRYWKKDIESHPFAAGGAIITGLAARAKNIQEVQALLPEVFSALVLVTAEDPRYESWLCFKGSVYKAPTRQPERHFLHLDIGGGTTNISFGRAGEVDDTGSFFVGARHIQFESGTQTISALSHFAEKWFGKKVGDTLDNEEVSKAAKYLCEQLESLVREGRCFEPLVQSPLRARHPPPDYLSFSGGIAGWIYGSEPDPKETTPYNDLGLALARAIRESSILKAIPWVTPAELGFATVAGLALFGCSFSGQSVFLPASPNLPLSGIPIVHSFLVDGLEFAKGTAVFLSLPSSSLSDLEAAVQHLSTLFEKHPWLTSRPLVLLINQNVGKTLGNLLTQWGKRDWPLYVIDQIPPPNGQFVHIGKEDRGIVPVSYYGMI